MTTSSAISAPCSTTAVGWTRAIRSTSAVDDAREELALRAEGSIDARLAAELPDVGPVMHDRDLEIEAIPRNDGPAELRLVDPEEVEEAPRLVERLARVGQDAADLSQRFDHKDS